MSRVTPLITTPDGREMRLSLAHPARYSDEHIQLFADLLAVRVAEVVATGETYDMLDPMGGVGGIHALRSLLPVATYANELEAPYVAIARQLWPDCPTEQGDAGSLSYPAGRFKACVWSPDFGGRLADHHNAKDPCRCRRVDTPKGTGDTAADEQLTLGPADPSCKLCKGFGLSMRRSYTFDLRRLTGRSDYRLDDRSSAVFRADQPQYWERQQAYVAEAFRVTEPGGVALVDVKDVVRNKRIMPVVDAYASLLASCGWQLCRRVPVPAPGYRFGRNRELRSSAHEVIVCEKPGTVS